MAIVNMNFAISIIDLLGGIEKDGTPINMKLNMLLYLPKLISFMKYSLASRNGISITSNGEIRLYIGANML